MYRSVFKVRLETNEPRQMEHNKHNKRRHHASKINNFRLAQVLRVSNLNVLKCLCKNDITT